MVRTSWIFLLNSIQNTKNAISSLSIHPYTFCNFILLFINQQVFANKEKLNHIRWVDINSMSSAQRNMYMYVILIMWCMLYQGYRYKIGSFIEYLRLGTSEWSNLKPGKRQTFPHMQHFNSSLVLFYFSRGKLHVLANKLLISIGQYSITT